MKTIIERWRHEDMHNSGDPCYEPPAPRQEVPGHLLTPEFLSFQQCCASIRP